MAVTVGCTYGVEATDRHSQSTTGLTTGCIHDTAGCQTGLTTGWMFVYTINETSPFRSTIHKAVPTRQEPTIIPLTSRR